MLVLGDVETVGVVCEGEAGLGVWGLWLRGRNGDQGGEGLDYGRLSLVEGEEKNQQKGVGGLAAAVLGEGDES